MQLYVSRKKRVRASPPVVLTLSSLGGSMIIPFEILGLTDVSGVIICSNIFHSVAFKMEDNSMFFIVPLDLVAFRLTCHLNMKTYWDCSVY